MSEIDELPKPRAALDGRRLAARQRAEELRAKVVEAQMSNASDTLIGALFVGRYLAEIEATIADGFACLADQQRGPIQ